MPKKAKRKRVKKPTKAQALNKVKKKVSAEKYFVLANGQIVTSLKHLALELESMGDDVFYYHVNQDRNDFSNWIKDVIQEIELAEKLMDVKEKNDFELHLLKHIVKLV